MRKPILSLFFHSLICLVLVGHLPGQEKQDSLASLQKAASNSLLSNPQITDSLVSRLREFAQSEEQPYYEIQAEIIAYRKIRNSGDHEAALSYTDSILMVHNVEAFPALDADISKDRADLFMRMGSFDQAISAYNEALDYYQKAQEMQSIGRVYRGLSSLYRRKGDYAKSLEYIQQAIDLAKQDQDVSTLANCYNSLGILYKDRKEWNKSIEAYRQSLAFHQDSENSRGEANALVNIGGITAQLGNEPEAIQYFEQALGKFETLGNQRAVAGISYNLSIANKNLDKPEKALEYCIQSLDAYSAINQSAPPIIYSSLGELYALNNRPQESRKYLEAGIEESIKSGQANFINGAHETAARTYAMIGDYQSAYNAHVSFKESSDSLFNAEMDERFLELETDYQVKEKDAQIASLEEKQQQERIRQYFMIGILALVGLTTILLWRNNQIRKRANRELSHQKQVIEEKNNKNEILLREIHHRVKNNLQFISSLLDLQSEHVNDLSTLGVLQEGQDRVQSMALIHQSLYQEDNLVGIETKEYLEKLTDNLFQSYNVSSDRIHLNLDIQDLNIDVDTMIPIGLIINELVSNSLKYAFPGQQTGEISVSLSQLENQIYLSVRDNGIGIGDKKLVDLQKSFGYRLVNAFARQLNAELNIINDHGTEVILRIRKYKLAS